MSVSGLIASGVMLAIVLLFLLLPILLGTNRTQLAFINKQRERALAYYERVLTNIRDLDEDHVTGKISEEEYTAERAIWVDRGVKLLKLLDELDDAHSFVDNTEADDAEIDAAIETALRDLKPQGAN